MEELKTHCTQASCRCLWTSRCVLTSCLRLQIHFNMATSGGSIATGGSCSKNPSTFNPTKLDTDQWVASFTAFGAREAVLVAKHSCGFVTWPSNATMPDGSRYNYSVASSSWREGKGDVVASFKASCLQAGLGVGYYYSLGDNSYTKGLRLTAKQLEVIELQQMRELWSGEYGNGGNLSEIWFVSTGDTLAAHPSLVHVYSVARAAAQPLCSTGSS